MDKVLRWCLAQRLFSRGETVVAALSGGADSVAMLHLLLSLRGELGISVRAAHYNHRLRGGASDRDEAFCRALCEELDVPLAVGAGDVAAYAGERGMSVELAARKLRYDFLLAQDGLVATAHTAGDNLETVLLNLTRGTALRGLCGIPPKRGRIVRPILCLTRGEILDYLDANGLPHVEDASNAEPFCRRNRVRQRAVPVLLEENPALLRNLSNTLVALRGDEDYLLELADGLLERARLADGYDVKPLSEAPAPVRVRALRRFLEDAGLRDVSGAHLDAVCALLHSGPSAKLSLPGGLTVRRVYGVLTAQTPDLPPFSPFLLPLPGEAALSAGRSLVCAGPLSFHPELSGMVLKLEAPPLVRPRREGDRLRLSGGSKTLKKWMIDRKLPAARRGGLPVLELDGTVIAAWGVGIDPAFRPKAGEACYRLTMKDKGEVSQV